jgi:maltose alpha-D-glucosyltransferase/alpha-amylase
MEKAIYEVGYELNNRPNWLQVPIAGIEQLLGIEVSAPDNAPRSRE